MQPSVQVVPSRRFRAVVHIDGAVEECTAEIFGIGKDIGGGPSSSISGTDSTLEADRPTSDGDPRRPDGAGRPRPRGHVNETIALLWKRPMRLCSPSNKIVISLRSPSNEEDQAHMRLCNQHGAATEATCIYRASAAPSAQTPSRGQT